MLDYITIHVIIAMGACIVSYFWGKYQNDPDAVIQCTLDTLIPDEIIHHTLDTLRDGGYIKTKTDENGEEEVIKLDD